MVLAGDDDLSVNFANIKAGVAQACSHHLPIEFVHRPGLDHDPLMDKTTGLRLDWTRARARGPTVARQLRIQASQVITA